MIRDLTEGGALSKHRSLLIFTVYLPLLCALVMCHHSLQSVRPPVQLNFEIIF